MNKINFHLPGIFGHRMLITYIIYQYVNNPHMFYDWVNIDSVYGCPANILLTGGRDFQRADVERADYIHEELCKFLKSNDIGCTLVLSNSQITEELLDDPETNKALKLFEDKQNSVVLASDIFEEYIRKTYPLYKIHSSVTKILTKEQIREELEKDYDIVCLLHDHNKDFEFLSSLPHPEKIELIPNHMCNVGQWDHCREHYKFVSQCNLEERHDASETWNCPYEAGPFFMMMKKRYFIKAEEIPTYADRFGITHFKINGRHLSDHDLFECLAYYLIKPEYQIQFRTIFYLESQKP